jgi:hypothetical protein
VVGTHRAAAYVERGKRRLADLGLEADVGEANAFGAARAWAANEELATAYDVTVGLARENLDDEAHPPRR